MTLLKERHNGPLHLTAFGVGRAAALGSKRMKTAATSMMLAIALTSCANRVTYTQPDAAVITNFCPQVRTLDGKAIQIEADVSAVDGRMPEFRSGCRPNEFRKINPNAKQLNFWVGISYAGTGYMDISHPQMDVSLRPSARYKLRVDFDGKVVKIEVIEEGRAEVLASGEAPISIRQSTGNPALHLIPLLVK